MSDLSPLRQTIRDLHLADDAIVLTDLAKHFGPDAQMRASTSRRAADLVRDIRGTTKPGLMEVFLAEYGLSTDEGVALMCLAEALLRVPDAETIDELIEDKIAPSSWGAHLGHSSSSLVNASTWALMLTGRVLQEPKGASVADTLRRAVRRLGEPVIRVAVRRAMQEMGQQFVLGEDIDAAMARARTQERAGYTYSYDMLGEAALAARDADAFFTAYATAIGALAQHAPHPDPRDNPGISIKLSALHPRYETSQKDRVMAELVPRLRDLTRMACDAGIGLNIDAEEADRLDLSLDVIEAVLSHPDFAGWDGFGVVVQAYGKRAGAVIDWLHALAERFDRKIMVRLVKGAYWDTEIKRAQVEGLAHFPVYSDKAATDVSYICCARKLLDHSDRLYPQFATHNAHTVAAILDMAGNNHAYEFQRLHGMGAALHDILVQTEKARCRIYAPVGPHKDLLAYLVRRLLENGANSSFVNQIVDEEVPAETVARDPFDVLETTLGHSVTAPSDIFAPTRRNSAGWDLNAPEALARLHVARDRFAHTQWGGQPLIIGPPSATRPEPVRNPANPDDSVGQVTLASIADVDQALAHASPWSASPAARRQVLWDAADLYEAHAGELFALLCREAGKTGTDAVSELREAVDFLRFYGSEAERFADETARGTIACISPWNFPLAIFTGQIAAALAAGNAVLAKPADPTPLVATCATRLLHQAGVPAAALQLLPGTGQEVGAKMTSDPRVDGICFTGSTRVAQIINQAAAASLAPDAMFIAETGGLNAMIVDSTALPEQAVRDILDSAFRSCGQRCSALRVLYLQEDVAAPFLQMLYGAMEELALGDPWDMATDVGPVITEQVHAGLSAHVEAARRSDRLLKQVAAPGGLFFGPAVIAVDSILDLEHEMFGPILHVATFKADQIDQVVDDINRTGYGLTFGLHTRIDDRVEQITKRLQVGNLYVNRNQIGAVVGSQPFGGDGMSGTGPKAGGPRYLEAFFASPRRNSPAPEGPAADVSAVQAALDAIGRNPPVERDARALPGPTGESNRWSLIPRGTVLCLGPTPQDAKRQMDLARACGCAAVGVAPGLTGAQCVDGVLDRQSLTDLSGVDVVVLWSDAQDQSVARQALAARDGPMLRLVCADDVERHCLVERHLCVDTTAAGGNATLLAAQ